MTNQLWNKPKKCFFTNRDFAVKVRTEEEWKSQNQNRYTATDKHKYTTVEYDDNEINRLNRIIAKLSNGHPVNIVDYGIINIASSQVIDLISNDHILKNAKLLINRSCKNCME